MQGDVMWKEIFKNAHKILNKSDGWNEENSACESSPGTVVMQVDFGMLDGEHLSQKYVICFCTGTLKGISSSLHPFWIFSFATSHIVECNL